MTENKDKDKDNEKEKDKEKDHERCLTVVNFADKLDLPTRKRSPSEYSGEDLLMVPQSSAIYKTSCLSITSEILTIDLDSRNFVAKDETTIGTQRVYKKTSPNSILTLYLPTREIISCGSQPSILKGILFVDPKLIQGYRVYAQLTLTFRYGREDEEVMGLRFCNEAIMSLHQIWPRTATTDEPTRDSLTPLQDALIKRLGNGAHPFTLSLSPQSPPSVQLVPAKRYYGAPIGTSYDVRCFIADKADEKFRRRATVKMGVRVIHKTDVFTSSGPENFAALVNNPSSSSSSTSPPLPNQNNNKSLPVTTVAGITTASGNVKITTEDEQQIVPSIITIPTITATTTSTISIPPYRQQNRSYIQQGGGVSGSCTGIGYSGGGGGGGNLTTNPTITSTIHNTSINFTNTITTTTTITTTNTTNTSNKITNTTTEHNLPSSQTTELVKHRKSERVDSFPKIRLSPKSFRFSGRFGRSKSEVERGPSDPFYNYSKSFQEVDKYDFTGGPQGAVDKPFLLQEGRVGLRASLNKSWYTHGEDVIVTVNVKNDSKKTVRRMRVCAIQHVDVCMFNNGKFKNIVADSDSSNNTSSSSSSDQTSVGPGKSLNSTFVLKPKRGPTKNWIALEDALQRSSEPDEITGSIAASAIRLSPPNPIGGISPSNVGPSEDRNVFAIYVSYYVKVKLTLSAMGGELSLKLPFSLVHIELPNQTNIFESIKSSSQSKILDLSDTINKITLNEQSMNCKKSIINKDDTILSCPSNKILSSGQNYKSNSVLNKIESMEDEIQITISCCTTPGGSTIAAEEILLHTSDCGGSGVGGSGGGVSGNSDGNSKVNSDGNNLHKRKLIRSITVENDLSEDEGLKDQNVIEILNADEIQNNDKSNVKNDIGKKCDNVVNANDDQNLTQKQNHQQTICAQVHSSSSH